MSASLERLVLQFTRPSVQANPLAGLINFIGIGGTAATLYVLVTTALIGFGTGVPDWIVNTVCYGAMVVPVYLLHRRFSFKSDVRHGHALPRYLAVQGMAVVLAGIFSYLIHGFLTLPTILASMLVVGLTAGLNFIVLRGWAFARGQMGRDETP